jgi:hypothetical protein
LIHFEEAAKYFPQEFSAMFIPGAFADLPKIGKGLLKGDRDSSLEHGELKPKDGVSQDEIENSVRQPTNF